MWWRSWVRARRLKLEAPRRKLLVRHCAGWAFVGGALAAGLTTVQDRNLLHNMLESEAAEAPAQTNSALDLAFALAYLGIQRCFPFVVRIRWRDQACRFTFCFYISCCGSNLCTASLLII
eukprot:SAG11_NODE_138_length_15111_cov_11.388289_11_plen_120_part_00